MTDARLPEKWLADRRLLRLSDAGFRLHVTALMWSVSNRTDGVIEEDDLPLIPRADPGAAGELEKVGLWAFTRGRWLVKDFGSSQTSKKELEQLERVRERERLKKARQRAAAKEQQPDGTTDVPGDSPGDQEEGQGGGRPEGQKGGPHRLGQDRLGKARRPTTTEREVLPQPRSEGRTSSQQEQQQVDDSDWPTPAVPGSGVTPPSSGGPDWADAAYDRER